MKFKSIFGALLLTGAVCTSYAQKTSTITKGDIDIPNIKGYLTLKCDFHMHTVFSDGLVWPSVRVEEAYREGLDAIALTEHIEYRPHKKVINADHNYSHESIMDLAEQRDIILVKGSEITRSLPLGHSNAIYLKDSNPLDVEDPFAAFAEAKKQGAFIFWNHPGYKQYEQTEWFEQQTKLFDKGYMMGIEVANSGDYYPEAVDWALEKNLTMMGTSDVHQPIGVDYDFAKGEHRTMTLVFAKKRSAESIREALDEGRTVAWYKERIIGKERFVKALFESCIEIEPIKKSSKGVTIVVYNNSQLPMHLKKTEHDHSLVYFREMTLKPNSRNVITVKFENGIDGGSLNFEVTNFLVSSDKGLNYSIGL